MLASEMIRFQDVYVVEILQTTPSNKLKHILCIRNACFQTE